MFEQENKGRYHLKNVENGKLVSDTAYEIPESLEGVKRVLAEIQRDDALHLRKAPVEQLKQAAADHEKRVWGIHEEMTTETGRHVNEALGVYNQLKNHPEREKWSEKSNEMWRELEDYLRKNEAIK